MKRLLLIGGGHSHVEVVRRFGRAPEPGVEVMLVSPGRYAGYSGMLPGLIAGHYAFDDAHIDLPRLTGASHCRFVPGTVNGLNPDARLAFCNNGQTLEFDIASIDIGSRPGTLDVPGACAHALGVKPLERFLARSQWALDRASAAHLPRGYRLVMVGAGAARAETLLSMQHRMARTGAEARFALVSATAQILPGHRGRVRRIFTRLLRERGIESYCGRAVVEVTARSVVLAGGERVAADLVVWAVTASAPFWPGACGLAVDAGGFIRVDASLQSVNRAGVFAAGDIAAIEPSPAPKSGVYAVRQGPLLAANLRRTLRGEPLAAFAPQRAALALVSTGNRNAAASRGWPAAEGAWAWHGKDWIDRRFMRRYRSIHA